MAQTERAIREQTTTVKGKKYKRFVVSYGFDADGKRVRKTFKSRELAEADIATREKMIDKIGQDAKRLNNKDLRDAVDARGILNGVASLMAAAKFYMLHHDGASAQRTVSEYLAEFLKAKEDRNLKPTTIKSYRNRLTRFAEDHGSSRIDHITHKIVNEWLASIGGNATTYNNYRRDLNVFFRAAKRAELIQKNPMDRIDTKEEQHDEASTFDPSEVRELMAAVLKHEADMVPYFAIGIWAGLRPENELRQLSWKDIDIKNRRIKVTANTAKRRRRRYVEMSDNLVEWLLPYRRSTGTIKWTRNAFDNARDKAGVRWPNDIMRHTYGSYHVAENQDPGKTMLQMGHKNMQTLLDHYVDARTKDDASEFWSITPKAKGNVVQFTKAG